MWVWPLLAVRSSWLVSDAFPETLLAGQRASEGSAHQPHADRTAQCRQIKALSLSLLQSSKNRVGGAGLLKKKSPNTKLQMGVARVVAFLKGLWRR